MINQIFEQLASDNSRKFKEDLLLSHKNNDILRMVIDMALNPLINFYIKKIPVYTKSSSPSLTLQWALDELWALADRKVTGHAGINHLASVLSQLDDDDAEVVKKIIRKDLMCGVSEATVNKIWKDLIPEFPCMLCTAVDEKNIKNIQWPAYAQVKYDGMRIMVVVKQGAVTAYTRNGKTLTTHGVFDDAFIKAADGKDMVFDGELLYRNDDGHADRQTGNGIGNKAVKGTISADEASHLFVMVWDVIDYTDFYSGKSLVPYKTRYDTVIKCCGRVDEDVIIPAPLYVVNTHDDALALFNQMYDKGEEGIILKDQQSIWEDKRSKHQLKFKGVFDCDLICVGWEEGTGKNNGKLGNIICETADGLLVTGVGSGFTDDDRLLTPDDIVGKIIKVQYNGKIKDKKSDKFSLFLPVYLCIRSDKDQADSIDTIKG